MSGRRRNRFGGAHLLLLDTETTGLTEHEWARVVEIGAVVVHPDGTLGATWSSLVCPDVLDERANEALAINHIPVEDIRAADPADVVVPRFLAWVNEQPAPLRMMSWRADFDEEMLARSGCHVDLGCLMFEAAQALTRGRDERYGLARAAADLGVGLPAGLSLHRALGDATLAALVAVALDKRGRRSAAGRAGHRAQQLQLAFVREGRAAFKAGVVSSSNPHPPETNEARSWARGWEQQRVWNADDVYAAEYRKGLAAIAAALRARLVMTGSSGGAFFGGELGDVLARLDGDVYVLAAAPADRTDAPYLESAFARGSLDGIRERCPSLRWLVVGHARTPASASLVEEILAVVAGARDHALGVDLGSGRPATAWGVGWSAAATAAMEAERWRVRQEALTEAARELGDAALRPGRHLRWADVIAGGARMGKRLALRIHESGWALFASEQDLIDFDLDTLAMMPFPTAQAARYPYRVVACNDWDGGVVSARTLVSVVNARLGGDGMRS